ncbi:MAG TPA: hypothetical protein VFN42_09445 [Acetobacteraceae bacterium]|nr:hypothetical protein [Acetobacteraceae bacterium]
MSMLMIVGALLALFGIVGLAIPQFTTSHTKNVATVGPLHVQATEHESHFVPPIVAGGALVLGIVLIGGGLMQRRP